MVYCDVPYGSDVLILYMVDINYMMKKLRDQIGCLYAKRTRSLSITQSFNK